MEKEKRERLMTLAGGCVSILAVGFLVSVLFFDWWVSNHWRFRDPKVAKIQILDRQTLTPIRGCQLEFESNSWKLMFVPNGLGEFCTPDFEVFVSDEEGRIEISMLHDHVDLQGVKIDAKEVKDITAIYRHPTGQDEVSYGYLGINNRGVNPDIKEFILLISEDPRSPLPRRRTELLPRRDFYETSKTHQ